MRGSRIRTSLCSPCTLSTHMNRHATTSYFITLWYSLRSLGWFFTSSSFLSMYSFTMLSASFFFIKMYFKIFILRDSLFFCFSKNTPHLPVAFPTSCSEVCPRTALRKTTAICSSPECCASGHCSIIITSCPCISPSSLLLVRPSPGCSCRSGTSESPP